MKCVTVGEWNQEGEGTNWEVGGSGRVGVCDREQK